MKQFIAVLMISVSFLLEACAPPGGQGTSTGNPFVQLKIASFNSTLSVQKNELEAQALNSLKFCFKRVRFKKSGETTTPDPANDSSNLDFYLGEVSISSLGTTLQSINLPAGTYTRVEFDLEDKCPSGKSVQLVNSHGSFSTDDRITIKFEGTFVHSSVDETLNLGIQQIVTKLNTVTNSSQIRNRAESVSGDFQ
jgi:hypothetical protein